MYVLSAEGYKNAGAHFLRVRKTGEIWSSMKDVDKGLGAKYMSERNVHGFRKNRKKLMIPESESPECPEHEIKSKWETYS